MSCVAVSSPGRRGEADISGGSAHGSGDVHLVRLGRGRLRLGVQDGHGQRGAVVIHRRLEQVAAVQVDPGRAEIDGADVERLGTIEEEPGRVVPLAVVVEKIELDGDALTDPRGCADIRVRAVAKCTAACPQGAGVLALDGEGEAVGQRRW